MSKPEMARMKKALKKLRKEARELAAAQAAAEDDDGVDLASVEEALRLGFEKTDDDFCKLAKKSCPNAGTTAVAALAG